MPFSDMMMRDKIQVLKSDGTISPEMNANVQRNRIYLNRSDFLIEPHDLIRRVMSNGGTETFKVIDPGFYEESGPDFPAHYQMKVQKLGLPEVEKAVQSITYNFSGANARVNNNATDNSTNIVNNNNSLQKALSDLRFEIERLNISDRERDEAYEVTDAIDAQCRNEKPSKVVVSTLVNSLPIAASIASIGSLIVSLV